MKYLFYIIICSVLILSQDMNNPKVDSLLQELETSDDENNIIIIHTKISQAFYQSNPDEGLKYAYSALDMAIKANWNRGIIQSYQSLALNYLNGKNKLDSGFYYYKLMLDLSEKANLDVEKGAALNGIGVYYERSREFDKALQYYQLSYQTCSRVKDSLSISTALSNIGNIYWHKNDYTNSLISYPKSEKIDKELNNISGLAHTYNNIGNIYSTQNKYDKAVEYHLRSANI